MNEIETAKTVVWVANQAGHPYTKVEEKLGPVTIMSLTQGNINPLRPDRLAWDIGRGIGRYVEESDYLLISGHPIVNALALAMWLMRFNACKLCLWDAKKGSYELSTVYGSNLENIIQESLEK